MNEKNIFEMIGTLDDKYVLEAAPGSRIKMKKGGRRLSAAMIAVIVAASVLTVGTAAAVISSNIHSESISEFYGDELVSKGYAVGNVTENGHFRITADSYVRDEYRGRPVFTVEALDDAAESYLMRLGYLRAELTYTDDGTPAGNIDGYVGGPSIEKGGTAAVCGIIVSQNDGFSTDLSRPLTVTFSTIYRFDEPEEEYLAEGLTLDLPGTVSVKDARLYSADGREVYISEIGIAALFPVSLTGKYSYGLRYKDGTEIGELFGSGLISDGQSFLYSDDDFGCLLNFQGELIDPDEIEAVTVNGEEFVRR
ncbi:MAG: hypothetical protein IJ561_05060 [Ruminococcus sp.]|nr:hypothetical protein [Ruminococcus sp.]